MGAAWIPIITSIIGAATPIIAGAISGGPNYPNAPRMAKLPVQEAKHFMQNYEKARMGAGIAAWKAKFPLLYAGEAQIQKDIRANQQGMLSDQTREALASSGLQAPTEGNQYMMSEDLGLSPITLAQRTSQAVNRELALNPEWTEKISGGTLASMIANNYQNQQAYTQFLGSMATQQYITGQQQAGANTQALLSGITGTFGIAQQMHENQLQLQYYGGRGSAISPTGGAAYPGGPGGYQPNYLPMPSTGGGYQSPQGTGQMSGGMFANTQPYGYQPMQFGQNPFGNYFGSYG